MTKNKSDENIGVQSTERKELAVESPSRTTFPWFIVTTSFLQVVVFFYYYLSENGPVDLWTFCSGCDSRDPSNPDRRLLGWLVYSERLVIQNCEFWRFLTYQFVHSGFFHLIHNLMLQCSVGIQLEAKLGSFHTALIYNLGVFLCPVVQWIMGEKAILIGASMGTYAVLSAFVYQIVPNYKSIKLSLGFVCTIVCCLRLFYLDYQSENDHTSGYLAGLFVLIVLKDARPVHGRTVTNVCGVVFFAFLTIMEIRDSYVRAANEQYIADYYNKKNYYAIRCLFNKHHPNCPPIKRTNLVCPLIKSE